MSHRELVDVISYYNDHIDAYNQFFATEPTDEQVEAMLGLLPVEDQAFARATLEFVHRPVKRPRIEYFAEDSQSNTEPSEEDEDSLSSSTSYLRPIFANLSPQPL